MKKKRNSAISWSLIRDIGRRYVEIILRIYSGFTIIAKDAAMVDQFRRERGPVSRGLQGNG
jgi:hypothetical protein